MYGAERAATSVYWKTQDQMLGALIGRVDVGPIEPVDNHGQPKK